MSFDREGKDLRCPNCGSEARLTDGEEIYSRKGYGLFWVCKNFPWCDHYVGCHPKTATPLGELADSKTRTYRHKVHLALDPLWQNGFYTRNGVYQEMSLKMNKFPFHTGELNFEECKKALEILKSIKQRKIS